MYIYMVRWTDRRESESERERERERERSVWYLGVGFGVPARLLAAGKQGCNGREALQHRHQIQVLSCQEGIKQNTYCTPYMYFIKKIYIFIYTCVYIVYTTYDCICVFPCRQTEQPTTTGSTCSPPRGAVPGAAEDERLACKTGGQQYGKNRCSCRRSSSSSSSCL